MAQLTGVDSLQDTSWRQLVKKYQTPSLKRSMWQVANSILPFFGLWYVMYRSLEVSYWLTLLLAVPTSGVLVRIFIIAHDCGHGAFFKSKKANDFVGAISGMLTFTPYYQWRLDHAKHHASSGDLDRRGTGDIWTMTITEYEAASRWTRFCYRIYRNPFVMFVIGPIYLFLVFNRIYVRGASPKERMSVLKMNLALAVVVLVMTYTVGLKAFLMIQFPLLFIAGSGGVWLFYVQHQFEGAYWERNDNWDFVKAAMEGSSFYRLPKVLQWMSGNIGFHHIHHLSSRIPNYFLEKCHKENPLFQNAPEITLLTSLKSLRYRLWDEENCQLVSFRALKTRRA